MLRELAERNDWKGLMDRIAEQHRILVALEMAEEVEEILQVAKGATQLPEDLDRDEKDDDNDDTATVPLFLTTTNPPLQMNVLFTSNVICLL